MLETIMFSPLMQSRACPITGRTVLDQNIYTFWCKNPLVSRKTLPFTLHCIDVPSRETARYVATIFSFEPPLRPLQDVAHDPTPLLSLNCLFFKDDSTKAFTVKIPMTDNVSILKELIKEKKARHLAHLDASDLALYKVSLSAADVDSHLKDDSKANPAVTRIPLAPLEELKEVFLEPLQKNHVHVIIEHGPGTCLRSRYIYSFDMNYHRSWYVTLFRVDFLL